MTQNLRVWSVWVLLCLRNFTFMASCFHCHSRLYQFVVSPGWSTLSCHIVLHRLWAADWRWKKDASLPASSCFFLIGILGTRSLPRCLLYVPRRNVGNEGMERRGVVWAPSILCYVDLKIDSILPFSNPSASLFSHRASFLVSPSSPSPSSSSLFLCKHPLWCPLITLLQCNPRQFWPYKRSPLDEGLTLGAVYFNTTVFSRLLRQN